MSDSDFEAKLTELMGQIETLPTPQRRRLEQLAGETRLRHKRLRGTVAQLQESLDYLRLSTKYLVFDLEATRRENAYLRKMLDESAEEL
ncbi:MAG: transcriptional regulator [Planctomycetota bacterium]